MCVLHWSEIQTCIHLNFYLYTDLLLRILSPIQQLLISALSMLLQKKIPVFPLQGITVTGSIETLCEFGLGNDGFGLWSTFSHPEGCSPSYHSRFRWEVGLQMMHQSPSSSWTQTSLVSSQKHPGGADRETPSSHGICGISNLQDWWYLHFSRAVRYPRETFSLSEKFLRVAKGCLSLRASCSLAWGVCASFHLLFFTLLEKQWDLGCFK